MNPLIRGLFDDFVSSQGLSDVREDDAFELFAASQILENDTLKQTELSNFLLDPGTPGLDFLVLEVNGQVIQDEEQMEALATDISKLDVQITAIQVKRSDSIDSAQIRNMGSQLKKFLEGGSYFSTEYSQINNLMDSFKKIFQYAAKLNEPPRVFAYYVTTAPKVSIENPNSKEAVNEIIEILSGLEYISEAQVHVLGSEDLYNAWNRKNKSNSSEIKLEKQVNLPQMPGVDQAILGVVSADQLVSIVSREDGNLDDRVFYENVRGFSGVDNPVNNEIIKTMQSDDSALLMVLNNGVTVVAESYSPKPGDTVSLTGYQIVNGCQTTHCLYLAKDSLGTPLSETYLPIKIVVTSDNDVAAQIIRATNSQTVVKESDLMALSSFQKRLEEYYRIDDESLSLTYERRTGQFYGKTVVRTRLVTINDQLRSIAAVALELPHQAARYPGRLYEQLSGQVFGDDDRLSIYVASAFMSYKLENAFRTGLEAKYKAARYHIMMVFARNLLGHSVSPLVQKKVDADARKLIEELKRGDSVKLFREAAQMVERAAGGEIPSRDRLKRAPFTRDLIAYVAQNK
ncbi:AIPR family protein [uncultured Kocuria sp.]|uniref:AIPR family protein n=1 Tax=uncultured Kocuria sp. TaxID=259305 RepID=UPI0025CFA305|nr:AIPR family protein [uncultured Kocuria sp.]